MIIPANVYGIDFLGAITAVTTTTPFVLAAGCQLAIDLAYEPA